MKVKSFEMSAWYSVLLAAALRCNSVPAGISSDTKCFFIILIHFSSFFFIFINDIDEDINKNNYCIYSCKEQHFKTYFSAKNEGLVVWLGFMANQPLQII